MQAHKKKVCIISFSPIYRDGRVLRQIEYLSAHYDLTVIGYGKPHPRWKDVPGVYWIQLIQSGATARTERRIFFVKTLSSLMALRPVARMQPAVYRHWYWHQPPYAQALRHALAERCDAYHANDWDALPVAAEAAQHHGARLVVDLHEYAPLQMENRWFWKPYYAPAITYFLEQYAPWVDLSTTVASPLAERYRQQFRLKPQVILNAPEPVAALPQHPLNPGEVHLIHHGVALAQRHPEWMVQTLALLDARYSLHFMLVNQESSFGQWLVRYAGQVAPGRVTFCDPVPPERIVSRIADFDMGLMLIPADTFNYKYCLPNKFFEVVAAGLACCVGPSPAMAELVNRYGFGCVAPSFEPRVVANLLNRLSIAQIEAMRQAARKASVLNAQVEMTKLVMYYRRLFAEADR